MKNIVKEIKKHEKRYTIILVAIFMLVIIGIGYLLLAVDNKDLLDNINTVSNNTLSLSLSSNVVTLNKDNNKNVFPIVIENTDDKDINYVLTLVKDNNYYKKYNIDNSFDLSKIKYSINNKEMKELKDGIILTGTINKNSKKKILIELSMDEDVDFHGLFKIKEK